MRRGLLALVPLALGAAATAVALALDEQRLLVLQWPLSWVWFELGVVLSVVLAIAVWVRSGRRLARQGGRDAAIAETRAERRRFVQRLDHELKNPVTALSLGISNLPANGVTAGLENQALRLSRVLTDLRRLGELETAPLEITLVDLEGVARDVVEAITDVDGAEARQLTTTFPRAPRPLPRVHGDGDLLFVAVYNLVANAVKYSAPGDRIELRGSEETAWVTLEVADTGIGIPDDELDTVWEELGRGSQGHAVPGSGLGLALVRAIVQRHEGSVELRSHLGEGTAVRIRLPTTGVSGRRT